MTSLPGGIAGASLKRGRGRSCRNLRIDSPRRNRRGLIEAPRESPAGPGSPSLPGGIAGASLKRASGGRKPGPPRRALPGGIAGASLKHTLPEVPPGLEAISPRRNRRGLIEAFILCLRDLGKQISPRRNRRGLIEAPPVWQEEVNPLMALPGGIAGASLKRLPLHDAHLRTDALPGGIAGASLKRPGEPDPEPRHRPLSPAESPGPH